MKAVDNTLYLGFSPGDPATDDGALLAKYENGALSPITAGDEILEQGMHDMEYAGNTLYIAGTDAMEDWTLGNIYTYSPGGSIVKHRNLTNVMHVWSLYADENQIFAGTGSHTGDSQTWVGQLFKGDIATFNNPQITDPNTIWPPENRSNVNTYRVMDVVKFNNLIYTMDYPYGATYLSYLGTGNSWVRLPNAFPNRYPRLTVFGDRLIAAGYASGSLYQDANALIAVDLNNNVQTYPLPGNEHIHTYIPASDTPYDAKTYGISMNPLAVDNSGYLYVITATNQLLRTSNLTDWFTVAQFNGYLSAIAYWPATNSIIISEKGANARIWKIDVASIGNLLPYATPTLTPTITPTPWPTMGVSAQGKIEYGSNGNYFFMVNPDGSNNVRVLSFEDVKPYHAEYGNLSPDGKYLVFQAYKAPVQSGGYSLSECNFKIMTKSIIDGSFEEWLPDQPTGAWIVNPHLSPDNNTVYFSMNKPAAEQQIYQSFFGIFKVKRGEKTAVPIIPIPAYGKYELRDISPDGTRMLYDRFDDNNQTEYFDIYISNIDGSNAVNLTNSMYTSHKLNPSFSSDGRKVLYQELNPANSTWDLAAIDLATRTKTYIYPTADLNEKVSCSSPDGRQLVYYATPKENDFKPSLYRANADGTGSVKIMDVGYNNTPKLHCWSPDPRSISSDTQPPAVTINYPPPGSVFKPETSVNILTAASDTGSGMQRVEFYVNGFKQDEDSLDPYSYLWTAPKKKGKYLILAIGYDKAGNAAKASSIVTVK